MRIAIIGGGIGGLASALALHRLGIEATVYERAPELHAIGAGLSLWPNATGVLQRLGVLAALQPHAGPITLMQIRKATGAFLLRTRVGGYATPAICAHRADLQRVLLDALPEGTVQLGREFAGCEPLPKGVRVHFADGTAAEAELLIGADGLRSRVRAALLGDEAPVYRGYTIWRGIGRRPAAFEHGVVTESFGPGLRFGFADTGGGRTYWYATANRPEGELHAPEDQKAEVRRLFGHWHDPVAEIIDATPDAAVLRNDAYDRPPRRGWHRDRVVLLGDAAHPTTPNLGQGGCMALESAEVLAQCLARSPSLDAALSAYERARYARTARITRMSRLIGWMGTWSGAAGWARDLLTRATPAGQFDRTMSDVYGYTPPANAPGGVVTSPPQHLATTLTESAER